MEGMARASSTRRFFRSRLSIALVSAGGLIALAPALSAQWLTQSFALTNGWNAIYLHVDASHTSLNAAVASDAGNPILEVWRWNPSTSIQFFDNPQEPIDTGS